jgi:phage tail-like protein
MRIRELTQSDCFHLEIEGISTGGFLRCTGLGGEVDVFEFLEGGTLTPRRFAGDRRFSPIVLERGLTASRDLYEWFAGGEPRDGAIVLLARTGEERFRWEFVAGWPRRWEGPSLDAASARIAVERLEIVHEGLTCLIP